MTDSPYNHYRFDYARDKEQELDKSPPEIVREAVLEAAVQVGMSKEEIDEILERYGVLPIYLFTYQSWGYEKYFDVRAKMLQAIDAALARRLDALEGDKAKAVRHEIAVWSKRKERYRLQAEDELAKKLHGETRQ